MGVLIDTFIVRPFRVPACAAMLWRGGAKKLPKEELRKEEPLYVQVLKNAA